MAYLTQTQSGEPVLILKEGTGRSRGREAQRNNIMAAKVIAEAIRSTLGPRGMDKMLVSGIGDITITNDGAAILDEIDVQHPAAKMIVEVAKTQDDMVGDGTTTAVVLSGELLKEAEELLEQNIHPTLIVSGYRKAAQRAMEVLDKMGITVDLDDRETLKKVAVTSMGSKAVGTAREHFADIAVDAVKQIAEKRGDKWVVDIDNVQIVKKEGKSLQDTELVSGIILDKEVAHSGMPKSLKQAQIALVNTPFEVEKTEVSAEIRIRDPTQIKAFLDKETNMLKGMVEKVKKAKANVLICQKGIDDMAQHFLAKEGILTVRRTKESDMEKLSRATAGKVITNLSDLKPEDLGYAELVEERKIGDDKMVFVEGCKNPKSVSILIRAGLQRMVDEAERVMHDALSVVADIFAKNKVVVGGGAVETEVAKKLREYAVQIGGREQLAVEAFAKSLEAIPKTLAENAGLEQIDIMVELRSAHEKPKGHSMGVDVFAGKVVNMYERGVIEPLSVKEQAIKSAAEASTMILRIDDVISGGKTKAPPGGPGGMPGGY
ncbi:MAG: thermosome subunit beta [Candidatus Bathyarchaeota archaeon]|nr:thermosome subunit beta [Candidatus Bathyarchaeota archaeon]MDH5623168.1 thermosome subunit beta [Candidatus Bathyarchaeota archaeon]MDH5635719.1 thermosome subunit beta [Candidatus Bathyarchaeota archaeon]MDH5702038.1 thermosome subunit beta [Candidatus Bathyarchaeota archaeon]